MESISHITYQDIKEIGAFLGLSKEVKIELYSIENLLVFGLLVNNIHDMDYLGKIVMIFEGF